MPDLEMLVGDTVESVPPWDLVSLVTRLVFMATEPLAGRRHTEVTERRTKTDWARFVRDIAGRYPGATRITLVMDNLNTHRPGAPDQ